MVNLFQLAPQLPFQVRIDHGQWLVEKNSRDIGPHQAATERDLLLGVGREIRGAPVELIA